MKKFLLKTCWFILPLLLGGVIMELGLRNIPSEYEEKSRFLKKELPHIETLMLGSSHALYGLNSEILQTPAFNLSHVSQTIDLDLALLKKFGTQMPKLKRVIVTLSYFSMRETLETTEESWRLGRYRQYYDLNILHNSIESFDLIRLPFNFNVTRLKQYYFQHQQDLLITPKGWSTKYRSNNPIKYLVSSSQQATGRHSILQPDPLLIEENKSNLKSIASWCAAHHVKLYLITTPTYSAYRERMDPIQWNEVQQQGYWIQNNFPGAVYLNWIADTEFEDADFHDGDHLSEKGAIKITNRLQNLFDSERLISR